jgi:hypothetical protein
LKATSLQSGNGREANRDAQGSWQICIQPDALENGSHWVHAEHPVFAEALREAIELAARG